MKRLFPYVLLIGLLGCGQESTVAPRCSVLAGQVGLTFEKEVAQLVAAAFLDSLGLPRLDEEIEDGCHASIRVLGGDSVAVEVVGDLCGQLLTAAPRTFLLIYQDSLGYRLGALFHGEGPDSAAAIIATIPRLAVEYLESVDKHAVVGVPEGTEKQWVTWLTGHPRIREARRLWWCPV